MRTTLYGLNGGKEWTTACELAFVRDLGTHSAAYGRPSRLDLLRAYRATMDGRTWDGIDRDVVRAAVDKLIRREEQRP